jgi:hypothetical protein
MRIDLLGLSLLTSFIEDFWKSVNDANMTTFCCQYVSQDFYIMETYSEGIYKINRFLLLNSVNLSDFRK